MTSKVSMAALCALILLSTFSSADSASCCLRYSKRRLPCKIIQGYSVQTITGSCDIRAVIFHLPGRFVCADPTTQWTRMRKKCVDERRRTAASILAGAASHNATLVKASSSSPSA
ncbi:C-C motif chemokine 20b [Cololabis saira]|uniref:C-C motif chemokine 20b n=1 Tax=Cololabis saira TaxID=129043 RepID=UPI002AD5275F|nr:C-C motif chemokine 20b [Cololabis saira]